MPRNNNAESSLSPVDRSIHGEARESASTYLAAVFHRSRRSENCNEMTRPKRVGFFLSRCLTALTASCAALALLALPACTGVSAVQDYELQRTWDNAMVLMKDENLGVVTGRMNNRGMRWALNRLEADDNRAVLIYLHGCDGLYWNNGPDAFRKLAERGYIVIAPDSFARDYRPEQCGAQNRWTAAARFGEIRHARQQLSQLAWVDQGNVFLAGGSEGGYYAGAYNGSGFRGRIVMSAPCWFGIGDMPNTLAVWSKRDPWMRGYHCAQANRKVVLDSEEHNVLMFKETADAIQSFLEHYTAADSS